VLAQVLGRRFIWRAVDQPELFGEFQAADLLNFVIGFNQPSIGGKIENETSVLTGRQGQHIKFRRNHLVTKVMRQRLVLFCPRYRLERKRAIVGQIGNRQGFIGGIGQR
jgi:hypothetical protein